MNLLKALLVCFIACLPIIVGLGVVALFALWTDRNLDFWVSYYKGVAVNVPYWLSFLVTLIFNGVALAANVISEIVRLLIG